MKKEDIAKKMTNTSVDIKKVNPNNPLFKIVTGTLQPLPRPKRGGIDTGIYA